MKSNTVLLDTNFIISCIKKKIDCFEILQDQGLQIIIPKQVIEELEKIYTSKQSITQKNAAHIALKILKRHIQESQIIDLKEKIVDKGILTFVKAHPQIKVATLDKALKTKLKKLSVSCVSVKKTGKIEL